MSEVRGGVHRLLALLIVGVALLSAVSGAGAAARPNIVFVLTDDQRFDTLGAMPTVQRDLVGRGVTFTNAFVVNALCCPSRASILTGRYSHSTNVYGNNGQYGGFGSFRDRSTVGTWLRSAGYRTGYVGKYLNGYRRSYVPPGWDRWVAFTRVGYDRYELNVDGSRRRYWPGNPAHYSTDVLTRQATRFIRAARKPFLLVYAPFAPHSPAVPALRHANAFEAMEPWRPPNYNEQDVSDKPTWIRQIPPWSHDQGLNADLFRRRQLQTLLAVDDGVNSLLGELRRRRILRDTIVVFMSDNGYSWGAHRVEGKGVPYEESIRVPLVIRYDRLFRGSRIETRTALNIDLAPTFAAAARAKRARVDGQSLLGIVRGSATPGREDFLVEHLRGAPYPAMPTYCGVRSSTWKYVFYGTGEDELYDLTADPYELKSRAADPAYRTRWWQCAPAWTRSVRRPLRTSRARGSAWSRLRRGVARSPAPISPTSSVAGPGRTRSLLWTGAMPSWRAQGTTRSTEARGTTSSGAGPAPTPSSAAPGTTGSSPGTSCPTTWNAARDTTSSLPTRSTRSRRTASSASRAGPRD